MLVAHLAGNDYAPRPEVSQQVNLHLSRLKLSPPRPLLLNPDQRIIIGVIHCAGGQVPSCLFKPAMVWTRSGELGLATVAVPEVLNDDERREEAVKYLLDMNVLLRDRENDSLMVNPEVSSQVKQDVDYRSWRVAALAVTCRAFPEWPHIVAE